jgi:arylsulfatase
VAQSDRWSSAATEHETTGVSGSPSTTTTIDGRQLPPPPPEFGGKIDVPASDRSG